MSCRVRLVRHVESTEAGRDKSHYTPDVVIRHNPAPRSHASATESHSSQCEPRQHCIALGLTKPKASGKTDKREVGSSTLPGPIITQQRLARLRSCRAGFFVHDPL